MLGNKAALAVVVGIAYALATQFLPIPETFKPAIGYIGLGGALVFGLWWVYAWWRDDQSVTNIADAYITNRNNTTNQSSLMHLARSGATKLKSERQLELVCRQIMTRTGFDPFHDYQTIPRGKRLHAIRQINDCAIDMDDQAQEMAFLISFIPEDDYAPRSLPPTRQEVEIDIVPEDGAGIYVRRLFCVAVKNLTEQTSLEGVSITLESIQGDGWNTTDKVQSKRTFRTPLRLPLASTRGVVPEEPFTHATDLHPGETAYFSLGYTRIGEAAAWVFGVAPFTHKPNTVNLSTRQEIEAGLIPTQVAPFRFTLLMARKSGRPKRFTSELKFPYSREDGPSPTFSPLRPSE